MDGKAAVDMKRETRMVECAADSAIKRAADSAIKRAADRAMEDAKERAIEKAAESDKTAGMGILRLRPYKSSDADFLLSWLSDERTVALWKADRFFWPLTKEQLAAYGRDFEADCHAAAFTALSETGKPVGHFSFRRLDWQKNRGHMGFIVVDPAARGKGYGRQMVHQALQYAFGILGLEAVTLGVYDCNQAASRCYEAEGFRRIDREGFEESQVSFGEETWVYYYMEARREKYSAASPVSHLP